LAKAVRSPSQAKSTHNPGLAMGLIRRGFFGPSVTSPSPVTADENPAKTCFDSPSLLLVKGSTPHSNGVAELGRGLSQPFSPTSSVSKSQLGYSRRVKEKVAKQLNKNKELLGIQSLAVAFLPSSQVCSSFSTLFDGAVVMESLRESGTPIKSSVSTSQLWYTWSVKEKVAKKLNKNKDLLAEAVGDIPVVGEDRVLNALNLAPVLGLSWESEDKTSGSFFCY
jgi:hypothetical protein